MILTIINQKGGVGKTTTVINIGVYLAQKGLKVLLVDLDPQANLTSGLGILAKQEEGDHQTDITGKDSKVETIYDVLVNEYKISEVFLATRIDNLSILPSG